MSEPKWNPMSQQFDQPPSLADFLLARIAEDEAAARGVYSLSVYWRTTTGGREFGPNVAYFEEPDDAVHVARWSPDRVLAECEAKRRIVAAHSGLAPYCAWSQDPNGPHGDDPCETLRLLAEPYADHPDYRAEWRP